MLRALKTLTLLCLGLMLFDAAANEGALRRQVGDRISLAADSAANANWHGLRNR